MNYLTIIQDVRRQIGLAEIMVKSDPHAAREYARKIMTRAKVSDCGRSSEKQEHHASDLCEAFLYHFLDEDEDFTLV